MENFSSLLKEKQNYDCLVNNALKMIGTHENVDD